MDRDSEEKMGFELPMIVGISECECCCHCGYCDFQTCKDTLVVELEDGTRVTMTEEQWAAVAS